MRRHAAVLAATALLVAGCGGGDGTDAPPEVTFAVDGGSVTARPTQHCDVAVQDCVADPGAAVVLAVKPGMPVRIAVPDAVGETPWLVVFAYRTKDGEKVSARSDLFAGDGGRTEYTLTLPDAADQLETVEVQQISGTFIPGEEGVEFPTRGTWVLSVDDR